MSYNARGTITAGTEHGAHAWFARATALVRRIIGAPDYDTYVRHVAVCHPGQPPLTEREFEEERLTARYSKPGQRCC